jgi:hypothetical protein
LIRESVEGVYPALTLHSAAATADKAAMSVFKRFAETVLDAAN